MLSREASVYANRQAEVYADMPGHVFVLPQFASTTDDIRNEGSDGTDHRLIFPSVGASLLPSVRGKQTMTSNLSEHDCVKCVDFADDGVDDGADHTRRRLTPSTEKNAEELMEDLWWDLSMTDIYGTAGGFNGNSKTSLDAVAEAHELVEVSLLSFLADKDSEYLRGFDKSPILMIDRLGPKEEMMTLDLAPEAEGFGGRKCFHLLRLAQLAAMSYKVGMLPLAFAVSYPKTRQGLCTESIRESTSAECDCELDSEVTIKEIFTDEVKRTGKLAIELMESVH